MPAYRGEASMTESKEEAAFVQAFKPERSVKDVFADVGIDMIPIGEMMFEGDPDSFRSTNTRRAHES